MSNRTISECLADVGITGTADDLFGECESLSQEFTIIKRAYHQKILLAHPDKGGDPELFRKTRSAFEVLRGLFHEEDVKNGTFGSYLGDNEDVAQDYDSISEDFKTSEVPSYEHFAQAAREDVPTYRVELARSNLSGCVKCAPPEERKRGRGRRKLKEWQYIPKGAVRVGSLNSVSGSYGEWFHLKCWQVPHKVWSGLTKPDDETSVMKDLIHMEEVLLSGVCELQPHPELLSEFIAHVMDRSNWGRATGLLLRIEQQPLPSIPGSRQKPINLEEGEEEDSKPQAKPKSKESKSSSLVAAKPKAPKDDTSGSVTAAAKRKASEDEVAIVAVAQSNKRAKSDKSSNKENGTANGSTSSAIVSRFVIPRPGKDGALGSDLLKGKRFVLTGLFPEVGGGAGLNFGKDKVRGMIEAFGGKVTQAISGKTDYLIVGKEPGATKVDKARNSDRLTMMDTRALQNMLYGRLTFEAVKELEPPRITSFSAGYEVKRIGYKDC